MSKKICCCRNCAYCKKFVELDFNSSTLTRDVYKCVAFDQVIGTAELDSNKPCSRFRLRKNAIELYFNHNPFDKKYYLSKIKKVIFNNPATIVFWDDGTKTTVICKDEDTFDKEKGLAMAISKYFFNNKGYYNDIFRKWCKEND